MKVCILLSRKIHRKIRLHRFHTIYNNGKLTIYAYFIPEIINDIHGATFTSIVSVLYLAIFPTIIPYVLLAYIVKSVGVSDATMSLYLTPIVSLLLSYLLLDELPTTLAIIGGIITLLGVSLSNFFQNT